MLDPDGQPVNPYLNQTRRIDRDVSELLGLAKGVLADGTVTEAEALLLRDWTSAHRDAALCWPIRPLIERMNSIFADGRVDEAERLALSDLLTSLVGGKAGVIVGQTATTKLPLDQPPPAIAWPGNVFVFTGAFAFGTRTDCERQVTTLGGAVASSITKRTKFVVIGTFGSRDWIQTSFGRKIAKAVEYRDSGVSLAIVGEDHWASSLP
jgi:hypothetical protein